MATPKRQPRFRDVRKPGERSTEPGAHLPVLIREVLQILDPKPGQVFVDCTLGFAGHSAAILEKLGPTGQLHSFDLDPLAIRNAEPKLQAIGNPFHMHAGNFAGIAAALAAHGVTQIDGLLADLGMSSMQVDDPDRGFSFMRDGPLDMRMDPTRGRTAADLLATLSAEELTTAFHDLGDEPQAERIAIAIVERRQTQPLSRTLELKDLILTAAPVQVIKSPGAGPPHKQRMLPTTRVFQALRILVNRELANLQNLLRLLPTLLKPGGVVAIISFHSGEDRLIKAAFVEGRRQGIYSHAVEEPVRPTETEKLENPRARSAKLRWARKA